MSKKIKQNIKNLISSKNIYRYMYYLKFKRLPNLKNPTKFSEKIQYLKLYGNLERYNKYVDKYEIRNYVKEKIGDEYLNELIGVYESEKDIDFEILPNKFVIKSTHGCAQNIVCKDKQSLDINQTKIKIKEWLNTNYYFVTREPQYNNIKPRIIIEKYLQDKSGELMDYKFFCFNGKVDFIEIHQGRYGKHTVDFYDVQWNKMSLKDMNTQSDFILAKPKNLDTMVKISENLAEKFPFVRVDLYYVDDKIYFGELTFTPANGLKEFYPYEEDLRIANKIDLNKYL